MKDAKYMLIVCPIPRGNISSRVTSPLRRRRRNCSAGTQGRAGVGVFIAKNSQHFTVLKCHTWLSRVAQKAHLQVLPTSKQPPT